MLAWSNHYLMGVEELDREHRQIFEIAGGILERLKSQEGDSATRMFLLREGLNYLRGYFDQHAAREEAYMRKINYPRYALHKLQHADFQKQQMAKYQRIVDSGVCRKEDAWDFIGNGIGWLLEHITTSDMDIVGKGVLQGHIQAQADVPTLERELDVLFAATLNLEAHTKLINPNYMGEPFGRAICQKFVYRHQGRDVTVISGIESAFVLQVAKSLYGNDVEDEMSLILSTVEMFGARFWITLYRQMVGDYSQVDIVENHFLVGSRLQEELYRLNPTVSMLFTCDGGKFFLADNSQRSPMALAQHAMAQ